MTDEPVPVAAARVVSPYNPANILTVVRIVLVPVFLALVVASSLHGTGHRYQAIAAICSTVLSLPPRLAGMMPYRITQNRSAVTPHSRTRIRITTHHHTRP